MSIVITSTPNTQTQAPAATGDKAQATESAEDVKPSVETQGLETKETTEVAPKDADVDGENEDDGEEPLAAEDKPKKKSGIQRLKERQAREVAELRREIDALKTQDPKGQRAESVASQELQANLEGPNEPQEETFESHKDYVKALAKWTYEQEKAQDQQKSKEAQAKDAYQSQIKQHNERVAKHKESSPEYQQVVEEFIEEHGDVRFSPGLQQAVFDSELGPAIIEQLLRAPDEFKRINELTPLAAAREIGKIEARLDVKSSSKKETKTTTNAPAPLKPVGGGSSAPKKSIFNAETQAEYERIRMEDMSKRRSAWG